MKKSLFISIFLLFAIVNYAQETTKLPYQNTALSRSERVEDLLNRLTPAEKVGLMMNHSKEVARLSIPEYNWWNEALHGVARAGLATVFPQAIAMAATFNDTDQLKTFSIISDEARAKYHKAVKEGNRKIYYGLTFWTPNINIFRDPRWGRGMETYGEDPYLTSCFGINAVKGLQGDDAQFFKTHACAKHFAVHSGPEWNRHSYNAHVSDKDLWETYLPAFEALVTKANVQEVMCAYNRLDDSPCCGSSKLLIDILRNKWNYNGLVVSDCGAIDDFYKTGRHNTHKSASEASATAVVSGTDIECGGSYKALNDALTQGIIKEADLNVSVRRILKSRFDLGMFDADSDVKWASIPYSVVDCQQHKDQALKVARESMTLLKNSSNTLPLNKNIKTIAVIGANANDSVMLWANYNGFPSSTTTILQGITSKIPHANIIYDRGCNLVGNDSVDYNSLKNKIKTADVIIYVGGLSPRLEGEEMRVNADGFRGGDRTKIELPTIQSNMLKALKSTGKPVVFVLATGSAIALANDEPNYDALLNAWYGGQSAGTAVADVLFGDYNPAGRLPITFYKSTAQLPDFESYDMKNRTYRFFKDQALYPFGFGLSYTTFATSHIKLSSSKIKAGKNLRLSLNIKNTGKFNGDEVIQVYIRNIKDKSQPLKSLVAFKRIHVKARKTQKIVFDLTTDAFKTYIEQKGEMGIVNGDYEIMIGNSSLEKDLKIFKVSI